MTYLKYLFTLTASGLVFLWFSDYFGCWKSQFYVEFVIHTQWLNVAAPVWLNPAKLGLVVFFPDCCLLLKIDEKLMCWVLWLWILWRTFFDPELAFDCVHLYLLTGIGIIACEMDNIATSPNYNEDKSHSSTCCLSRPFRNMLLISKYSLQTLTMCSAVYLQGWQNIVLLWLLYYLGCLHLELVWKLQTKYHQKELVTELFKKWISPEEAGLAHTIE